MQRLVVLVLVLGLSGSVGSALECYLACAEMAHDCHSCCPGWKAAVPPNGSPACCVTADQASNGPIEAKVSAPAPAVDAIVAAILVSDAPHAPAFATANAPPFPRSVPLFLLQHAFLI